MEHVWQWGQERDGGRKSMERWVGLMWPRELPERKMGKRGGGTLMAVSGCQHLRKMGPEWYICQTARVCVSVHMCDRVSHSLHLLQPNTSHPALSTPLPSTFTHPSFHSTLPPPLFTLTVIWQAQGWQTWSWQGKRLSGPAWSGSCWLAEEPTVRAGRCDWPGDWCEGGGGVLPLQLHHGMGWTGIERAQRGVQTRVQNTTWAQPNMCHLFGLYSAISQTGLRHQSDPGLHANPYPISHQTAAAFVRYFCLCAVLTILFEPGRLSRYYLTRRNSWQPYHENTAGKVNCLSRDVDLCQPWPVSHPRKDTLANR